jgi:Zn-dependent protease with chaperone function
MRGFLAFLNLAYAPFIGFLALVQLGAAIAFMVAGSLGEFETGVAVLFWVLGILCFLLFCWFLVPMYHFFTWHPEPEWIMDLKVSREEAPPLYALMDDVAKRCALPAADEIRLSALTDAAVYQTKKGRQVLLMGALTVASFPKEVVAAIMAHELAHIQAGDTAMLRDMLRTRQMMAITRHYYMTHPEGFCSSISSCSPPSSPPPAAAGSTPPTRPASARPGTAIRPWPCSTSMSRRTSRE